MYVDLRAAHNELPSVLLSVADAADAADATIEYLRRLVLTECAMVGYSLVYFVAPLCLLLAVRNALTNRHS